MKTIGRSPNTGLTRVVQLARLYCRCLVVPRVYLLFRNQIFSYAIQAILDKQPKIELVAVTNEPDRMAVDVVALNPDVILLEETENGLAVVDAYTILGI